MIYTFSEYAAKFHDNNYSSVVRSFSDTKAASQTVGAWKRQGVKFGVIGGVHIRIPPKNMIEVVEK
jgi:hypothetical protein